MSENEDKLFEEAKLYFSHYTNEIQFVKGQQWRTAYYGLLLLFAVIFLFAQPDIDPHLLMKIFATIGSGIVAIVSIVYQVHHLQALQDYRERLNYIENHFFGLPTNIRKKIPDLFNQCPRQKHYRTLGWYTIPFILLVLTGFLAAVILIWQSCFRDFIDLHCWM